MADIIEIEGSPGGRGRDRTRFDDFYRTHRQGLVRYAARRGADDPEGVADLAVLDGYRALDRMRSTDPRSIRAYLFRAVGSYVAREARSRPQGEAIRSDLDETLVPAPSFEDDVVGGLNVDDLLDQLSTDQQEVMRLRFVEGLTPAEAADVLGKESNAVRQIQHRAVRRLRRLVFAALLMAAALGVAVLVVVNASGGPTLDEPADPDVEAPDPAPGPDVGPAPVQPPSTGQPASTVAPTTTAPSAGTSVTASTTVPTEPVVVPPVGIAYEGFDLGLADGAVPDAMTGEASAGFADGSVWSVEAGLGLTFDALGLTYLDADGNELATMPGAIRVVSSDGAVNHHLVRPFADPLDGTGAYWVSFLVRRDAGGMGDAFWTPGGFADWGGAGLQQLPAVRFVNGEQTGLQPAVGETVFVVVRVENGTASLWVNPSLDAVGPPELARADVATDDVDALRFTFNGIGDGHYTIDEARVGISFAEVAPQR